MIRPRIVKRNGKASDIQRILALSFAGCRGIFRNQLGKGIIDDQLDIVISAYLVRRLGGDYNDAGILRLLQNAFQNRRIVWHDTDCVHTGIDEVLNDIHLLRGICGGRSRHIGIHAILIRKFLDTFFKYAEIIDSDNLDNNCNLVLFILCVRHCA